MAFLTFASFASPAALLPAASGAAQPSSQLCVAALFTAPRGCHPLVLQASGAAATGAVAFLTPARFLTLVAGAAADWVPEGQDSAPEAFEISWYKKRVQEYEETFRAAALFTDADMVKDFRDTAERAVVLIDRAVEQSATTYAPGDLAEMLRLSRTFRRVLLEAKAGYVLAASVVEATNALRKMMELLAGRSAGRRVPPYPSVVPYAVDDSEAPGYFRQLLLGFATLVNAAECATGTMDME